MEKLVTASISQTASMSSSGSAVKKPWYVSMLSSHAECDFDRLHPVDSGAKSGVVLVDAMVQVSNVVEISPVVWTSWTCVGTEHRQMMTRSCL